MLVGGRTIVLALLLALPACDKAEPKPPKPPAPSVPVPVTEAAKPAPLPAEPAPSIFVINDTPYQFPSAKLVIQQTDNSVRATLFSKDAPKPVEGRDTRNSFYFDMVEAGATMDELRDRGFTYDNSASAPEESTTGIFMADDKWRLQPLQVAVAFDTADNQTVAIIRGTFQLFADAKADQPPRVVNVVARLLPELSEKK